jgi:CRP/FNR family transcriptional regulator, cyclic AMP receptor protein
MIDHLSDGGTARAAASRFRTAAPWSSGAQVVRALEVLPELGARMSSSAFGQAVSDLAVALHYVNRGAWSPEAGVDDRRAPSALIVVDGLLARTVTLGQYRDVELLGRGDVVGPWHELPGSIETPATWRILEDASVAIVDRTFETACARYPGVMGEIVVRSLQRAQRQAVQRAISHVRHLDLRLLVLLWHLADRWGRVGREGVLLPLRLSHDLLADLAGARRPSVSAAIGKLERSGRIHRRSGGGWLLIGLPPQSEQLWALPESPNPSLD